MFKNSVVRGLQLTVLKTFWGEQKKLASRARSMESAHLMNFFPRKTFNLNNITI